MDSAVLVDRTMASALFREEPEGDEEDEDEKKDHYDEDEEEREDGYSELRLRVTEKHPYRSSQADFVGGRRNSITLPLCCIGSHFTRFEKLVGT
jgi:hypothetical protein